MTTHTLTIPRTVLPVGQTIKGPFAVGSNTTAVLTIDRTITGGLNSLTASSLLDVAIQSSPDGTTWNGESEVTWPGGISSNHHGQINTDTMTLQGLSPGATQVRLVATVTGPSSIAISGSCVVS